MFPVSIQWVITTLRHRGVVDSFFYLVYLTNIYIRSICKGLIYRVRGFGVGRNTLFLGSESCISSTYGSITFGTKTIISDRVLLKTAGYGKICIGPDTFIGHHCSFLSCDQIHVGSNVMIAGDCFFVDFDHRSNDPNLIMDQGIESKAIVIEDNVWIGAGATILKGVTIGEGAVIGAGAVVVDSIQSGDVVVGHKARAVHNRFVTQGNK